MNRRMYLLRWSPARCFVFAALLLAGAVQAPAANDNAPQEKTLQDLLAKEAKLREKLEEQLAKREKDLAAADKQIEQAKAEQLFLVRQIADLQKSAKGIAAIGKEMKAALAEVDRLTQALEQEDKARGQEQAKWQSRIRELEILLETEKARAATQAQEQMAQTKTAVEQDARSRKELESARAELAPTRQALTVANGQIQQLRADIASLEAKNRAGTETDAAARQKREEENSSLRQQAVLAAADLAALKKENKALAKQLKDQETVQAKLAGQLQQAAQDKETLAEQLAVAKAEAPAAQPVAADPALREQLGGLADASLVGSLYDAGLVLFSERRWEEAEGMFRRALAVLERTGGKSSPAAGTVLQHLADVERVKGDLVAAQSSYQKAAEIFRASPRAFQARYASALNGQACVLLDQKQTQEAEKLFRQVVRIYERSDSPQANGLALPLYNLGMLLMEQRRLDEAGPLLEKAVRILETNPSPGDDKKLVVIYRSMVRYFQTAGNLMKAAEFEQKARDLLSK